MSESLDFIREIHLPSFVTGAGLMGLATWVIQTWIKQRRERDKAALDACRSLRQHIPQWKAGVSAAVTGKTFDDVNDALLAFREAGEFEPKLQTALATLRPLEELGDLVTAAEEFRDDVLNVKHYLGNALLIAGESKFLEDFPKHRDEALKRLDAPLGECRDQLDGALAMLERRQDMIFPWIGRFFPTTKHSAKAFE